MTPFQHVASSRRKSVVRRPGHEILWTKRGNKHGSQQVAWPCWPCTGRQIVSHCHLEGRRGSHTFSRSQWAPAAASIWRRWHCWEQEYYHLQKVSYKHRSLQGDSASISEQCETVECRGNCTTGTKTLRSIDGKSDRKAPDHTLRSDKSRSWTKWNIYDSDAFTHQNRRWWLAFLQDWWASCSFSVLCRKIMYISDWWGNS